MHIKAKKWIGAATRLALFTVKEIQLDASHYDYLVDEVLSLLEESKDEAYRLRGASEGSPPEQPEE